MLLTTQESTHKTADVPRYSVIAEKYSQSPTSYLLCNEELPYLTALSILCQGYLTLCLKPNTTKIHPSCSNAFHLRDSFTKLTENLLQRENNTQILKLQQQVRQPDWWQMFKDQHWLTEVQKEWGADQINWQPVANLLNLIQNDQVIDNIEIVAQAYYAISAIKLRPLKEIIQPNFANNVVKMKLTTGDFNCMIKRIIAIKDNLITVTVTHVISTLPLGIQAEFLEPQDINSGNIDEKLLGFSEDSVILLTEEQLRDHLATLRWYGFKDAVLVLSDCSFDVLRNDKRYEILLNAAVSSHSGCQYPYQLETLLTEICQLKSMNQGNLNYLKQTIYRSQKNRNEAFEEVLSCLNKLLQPKNNFESLLQQFESQVNDYLKSRRINHHLIKIDGKDIEADFECEIQKMKETKNCEQSQVDKLTEYLKKLPEDDSLKINQEFDFDF